MQTLFDLFGLFRQRIFGCCLGAFLFLLLLALACGAVGWMAASRAAAAPPEGLDVMLLLDHSHSMWSLNGLGSDPELLRVAAANLVLSYLGADDPRRQHRAGVIHFGGSSEVVVPLMPLDDANRAAIRQRIADPAPIPWTDPAEALALAASELSAARLPGRRQAVLLLSDGAPAWAGATAADLSAYRQRLLAQIGEMGEAGVSVFAILLASPATDADPAIQTVWAPFWRQAVALTPRGAFFQAREAQELLGLYHQVAAGLTGGQVGRQIADEMVTGSGVVSFTVAPDLGRLTLVTWKSDPALTLAVQMPPDEAVGAVTEAVRYAGQPGVSHEEVWTVERPTAGVWTLGAAGEGRIAVWLDVQALPASPTPTTTITPTATASPTIASTPSAMLRAGPSATLRAGPSATSRASATATPTQATTPSTTPSRTPSPTSVAAPALLAPRSSVPSDNRPLWRWPLLVLVAIVALAGLGLAWRWRRPTALLEGLLQPIAVPVGATPPARIDLSARPQRQFRLGGGGQVDLALPGWQGQALLQAEEEDGETSVRLQVLAGEVSVDGRPIQERSLLDNDVLGFGDYRFRFRCLSQVRRTSQVRR